MKGSRIPAVAVALIVVGLAGMASLLLLGGPATSAGDGLRGPGGGMGMFGSGMRGFSGEGMDAMFIEQMIPHHDDAIAMAELALERSERAEIRRLAEDVRRSQTAENAQMRDWYREWYGTEVPETSGGMGMMGGVMGGTTDLDALERAEDFDKEFLEQMIPHHRMAVMMTRMAGRAGGREELRALTDSMRREQTREIRLMESWYRDWYGG
ncbi:MAG: DUF305 domain-containing protein [Thermoleophilia bacterium]|nr:DUF305 domain-containing protein [Thermoleophilia bacterium]